LRKNCEGLDAFEIIAQESRRVLERRPASSLFVEVVRKENRPSWANGGAGNRPTPSPMPPVAS
jgi:hypothetical protein